MAQLERWRHAGVLPVNTRTYLGRGNGSTSVCGDTTVEIAEAMAMVARQGRSLHEGVLRIFTVDPRHNDLFERPNPIPEKAIRAALTWFVKVGDQTLDRRIERIIRRLGRSPDATVEAVFRLAVGHYRQIRLHPGPAAKYRPTFWEVADRREAEDLAASTLAKFFGDEEIGADRIAEIITSVVRMSSKVSEDEVRRVEESVKATFRECELAGEKVFRQPTTLDSDQTVHRLNGISIDRIREVRNKLTSIAELGYLYVHGGARGDPMEKRLLDATTASIDANMIFHGAIPIVDTLTGNAWHRMSALLVMILTETEEGYADTFDKLAIAMLPDID